MRTTNTKRGWTAAAVALTVGLIASMTGVSVVSAGSHTTELSPGTLVITESGHYVPEPGATYTTVAIGANDVTLKGFTFDGAGTTASAVRNSVSGLENISILDSSFSGYTGRPITFGFAEGASNATDRASNIVIAGNTITDIVGTDATAIAVFDTDGVTIRNNTIDHTNAVMGRRGINVDGNSKVRLTGNTVALGAIGVSGPPGFDVFWQARWAIQVAQSNAPAVDYHIAGNTLSGSYDGVTVLSQGNVNGLKITGNDISAAFGVRMNTGSGKNAAITYSGVRIHGNRLNASAYNPGTGVTNGVRIQNQANAPLTLSNSAITGNSVFGATAAVVIDPTVVQVKVKVQGNKLS